MTISKYSGIETCKSLETIKLAYNENKEGKGTLNFKVKGSLAERMVCANKNLLPKEKIDCIDKIIDIVLNCFSETYRNAKTTVTKNLENFLVSRKKPAEVVPPTINPNKTEDKQTPSSQPITVTQTFEPLKKEDIDHLTNELEKKLDNETTATKTQNNQAPQMAPIAKPSLNNRVRKLLKFKPKTTEPSKTAEQLEKELTDLRQVYHESQIKMWELKRPTEKLKSELKYENPTEQKKSKEQVDRAERLIKTWEKEGDALLEKIEKLTSEMKNIDPDYMKRTEAVIIFDENGRHDIVDKKAPHKKTWYSRIKSKLSKKKPTPEKVETQKTTKEASKATAGAKNASKTTAGAENTSQPTVVTESKPTSTTRTEKTSEKTNAKKSTTKSTHAVNKPKSKAFKLMRLNPRRTVKI